MPRSVACARAGAGARRVGVSLLVATLALLAVLVMSAGSARADVYWIDCCNSEKTVEYEKDTWNQYFVGRAGPDGGAAEPEFANAAPENWVTRNVTTGAGIAAGPEYIYYPVNSGIARVPIGGGSAQLEFIRLSTQNEKHEWEGEFPYAIAVAGEYLYWASERRTKANEKVVGIGRAKLDGSEVITDFIPAGEDVRGLAIEGEHIYWREKGYIARANLNGTNVEKTFLNIGVSAYGYGLAANGSHLYWADAGIPSGGVIGRANINGTEQDNYWIRPPENAGIVGYIAADEQHVYWEAAPGGSPNVRSIARAAANAGGSGSPSPGEIEEQFVPKPEFFDGGIAVTPSQALTASVSLSGPAGAPLTGKATAPGSTVEATVTVSAPASDTAPVSALAADPPLTITPSSSLTFVSGPSPASIDGKSIAPGESVTYTDTYTIAGTGRVQAAVEVTGSYEGKPVSTSASTTAGLGQPLEVSVDWLEEGEPLVLNEPGQSPQANTIRLKDEDNGEVPQDVTALVTIKNISGQTEEDVSLNGVPALSYHSATHATQALPVGVTEPLPSEAIGTLAAGAEAEVEYTVHVTANGEFDFSPQVLSSDSASATEVSQGVGTLTVLPTALLWLSLHRVDPGLIRAGTKTEIAGTVTNRSLTQTIEVDPLEAEHEGNAGGGELISDTSTVRPDGVQLPFQGKIAPGETVDVTGHVYTAVEPETLGKITYEPTGFVLASDGSSTALTASQMGASAGSSEFAIGTEAGEPALPEATLETVLDNFSDAAVQGVGQWSVNEISGAANLLLHPITSAEGIGKGIAAFAVGGGHAVADASYFVGMVYMLAVAGESMTAEERGEFANQVVADFEASHLKADYTLVAQAAGKVLGSFEEAVRTGNYNRVAALAGGTLATGLTTAADALLSDIVFQKLTIGMKYAGKAVAKGASGSMANAITLADSIRDAKATATLGKTLEGIDAGTNLLLDGAVALRKSFGLTSKQITELRNYCQRSKIIIAVRSRSARAAELIKEGLAVGKNEIIKLKAVNQYDVDFLGYRKANLNTVVWAQPLSESQVLAELAAKGADAETREIVLDRLKLRQEEWKDPHIRHVIEDAEKKGSIDWSFDGSGNGASGANKSQVRRFELKKQPSPLKGTADRTYQEVLVGAKPGLNPRIRAVPITQDVDLMALLKSNGEIMSVAERVDAYIHLSDILGIEHGETPTWIKDGEIMFQKKAKQLVDVVRGGEQLAVFAPTGAVTAGFFNPALTIFDNVTKGGRIFFEGGYNNPYSKVKTQIELGLSRMG
jgi:hypothetical protein